MNVHLQVKSAWLSYLETYLLSPGLSKMWDFRLWKMFCERDIMFQQLLLKILLMIQETICLEISPSLAWGFGQIFFLLLLARAKSWKTADSLTKSNFDFKLKISWTYSNQRWTRDPMIGCSRLRFRNWKIWLSVIADYLHSYEFKLKLRDCDR